ncbi:hypothetical protein GCM10027046_15790 [Uliginosibacterium flavum]|uniref:Uncharacterized protein n=1 Tax=Uliginosibacterium flavum TaxID=1396831 RepID=A0ABV2TN45_9RHOO
MNQQTSPDDLASLLREMLRNQVKSIALQSEAIELGRQQLALAESQMARARALADESVQLQRVSVQAQRKVGRLLYPALVIVVAAVVYQFSSLMK